MYFYIKITILLTLFDCLKGLFNKHECNFGDVSQIKIFWNKDYNDVTNKNL